MLPLSAQLRCRRFTGMEFGGQLAPPHDPVSAKHEKSVEAEFDQLRRVGNRCDVPENKGARDRQQCEKGRERHDKTLGQGSEREN